MYRLAVSTFAVFVLVSTFAISTDAIAKKGGNGNGGGGGGDSGSNCVADALFPALIYQVGSGAGDGTDDIVLASSDGCKQLTVEHAVQLGGVRLKYDPATDSGYYAWSEDIFPGYPPGSIKRQSFTIAAGNLIRSTAEPETIYQGTGYLARFDIQGDSLAVDDAVSAGSDEYQILVVDQLSLCTAVCDASDADSVYSPSNCVPDPATLACFDVNLASRVSISPGESEIYFDVSGGIAHVTKGQSGWQSPRLYMSDDNYREPRVYGFDATGAYLAIGYLADLQQIRDDRVIIFDPALTGSGCPCEAAGLSQDFAAWNATWTVDNTLYVVGTAGKGHHLSFPIGEFDPSTGVRESLGISLGAHPIIDSSL